MRAVEREWAISLADVLLRRTPLGLRPDQAIGCADEIVVRMGELLGWDAVERAAQVADYVEEIAPMRRFATSAVVPPTARSHRSEPAVVAR